MVRAKISYRFFKETENAKATEDAKATVNQGKKDVAKKTIQCIQSNQFKSDMSKHSDSGIDKELPEICKCLESDGAVPEKYLDHELSANLSGFRCCHIIDSDLVLIYKKKGDEDKLELHHLNTYAKIFG